MFEKVLFPLEPRKEAVKTAREAIDLAKNHHSHLIILSIVQSENPEMDNIELLSSLIQNTQETLIQEGVSYDVLERKGNTAFVICDVADELNVDVIVLGTEDLNLEKDSQSTAGIVIQLSPCPVLVVP